MMSKVSVIGMLVYTSLISRETNLDWADKGMFDNNLVNWIEFFILYWLLNINLSCKILTNFF